MRYVQIAPCSGWVFITEEKGRSYDIAAWGLTENGDVIGLIGDVSGAKTEDNKAHLVGIPHVAGKYQFANKGA